MSKHLLVLAEEEKVVDKLSGKTFIIDKVTEADGSIQVDMSSEDGESISLVFAQKTGEEYWDEVRSAVDDFVKKTGDKFVEIATEITSDLEKLGDAFSKMNITKRAKGIIADIFGDK